jgi:antitoxin component HigA of HigAB toxin-antitoxin module
MSIIAPDLLNQLETLKNEKKYNEAISIVNRILTRDPHNHEALLQVADIQYRK